MALHLQIDIQRNSSTALREQLRLGIRAKIADGVLRPGTRLPSSRRLAADLRLARSVVVEAYQQLTAEGFLTTAHRSGTRVADRAAPPEPARVPMPGEPDPEPEPPAIRWDLRAGFPDLGSFPRNSWLACLQQALRSATLADLEYPPVAGVPALRAELATYLGRVRAVRTRPEHVMVTAGFAHGLALLCQTLRELGHEALAMEDPGHPAEWRFVEGTGLRVVAVPVDREGIDVDALAASRCRAVLVTPAHQFPTGATLSPRRRTALVTWARRVGGLVIEDDYDGEFWFDGTERPASVQGMAPDCVVYGGSVSKTLAPGLRFGWLVTPPALTPPLGQVRRHRDLGLSTLDQQAYALFLRSGRLDRHLRQSRARYRLRRDALVRALAAELPRMRVTGAAAGLHCLVRLPPGADEPALVRAAEQSGVRVRGLGYFVHERPPPAAGLVVGYAPHSPDALAAAVAALAKAAAEVGCPAGPAGRSGPGK